MVRPKTLASYAVAFLVGTIGIGSGQLPIAAAATAQVDKEKLLAELIIQLRAQDEVVCYSRGDGPDAYTLNVKKHSPLDFIKEAKEKDENGKDGHYGKRTKKPTKAEPKRMTYSAIGTRSFDASGGSNFKMTSLDGGITVANNPYTSTQGARMGLLDTGLVSPTGAIRFVENVECSSTEASATPETWHCEGLRYPFQDNGSEFLRSSFSLNRVDPQTASEAILAACEFFEVLEPGLE